VYNAIKEAVKDGGQMDTKSLELAVKKMRKEDPCGENSKNPNPLCCKHYVNPVCRGFSFVQIFSYAIKVSASHI
jgi:hypothetical protein